MEVISEGPHCAPCEYCIAAVEHVAADFGQRLEARVLETRREADARRYLELGWQRPRLELALICQGKNGLSIQRRPWAAWE